MLKQTHGCTTFLVGKKATLDGSTIIARDEDNASDSANPQRFVVIEPQDQPQEFTPIAGDYHIKLPDRPLRYTSTPDADSQYGVYGGAGINSDNVAMTATETITTNARILGIDPFVETGIGEADFVTLVLPYIHSAREGVVRLGKLLQKYGTYEPNGIAFSDNNEVWYLETIGGHHWAAIKIPDDDYAVISNRMSIQEFDFSSSDTLASPDLKELIEQHHLNPDNDTINLRQIFGSSSDSDILYNNPRVWYGHHYFDPKTKEQPEAMDLPLLVKAPRKISIEDIKYILSSHYQFTPYDPYGKTPEAGKYRTIGINRNLETHILQIRNNVASKIAAVHWLSFGPTTFNSVVPFYANVADTPASYRDTSAQFDLTKTYWLNRTIALLGDTNYKLYSAIAEKFDQITDASCRHVQQQFDQTGTDLEQANEKMATINHENSMKLFSQMVAAGVPLMKIGYSLTD